MKRCKKCGCTDVESVWEATIIQMDDDPDHLLLTEEVVAEYEPISRLVWVRHDSIGLNPSFDPPLQKEALYFVVQNGYWAAYLLNGVIYDTDNKKMSNGKVVWKGLVPYHDDKGEEPDLEYMFDYVRDQMKKAA